MKTESRPPYRVQRCNNLGLIDYPAQCGELTFDTLEKAVTEWKKTRETGPDFMNFLRLTDGDGYILADYMNFFSEKDGKQIHYENLGNPIPIIIAAKVAKKVGKEVIKRVEEKKKE